MAGSEAIELVALAQGDDLDAHKRLVVSHRRIVATLAKRYAQAGLSSDERIRLGEQGLGIAIERFNLAKGFSFSTYATWWIRQAITMGLGGGEGTGGGMPEPKPPQPSPSSASAAL
jgi:DNA-directed RNA polymerase sigma subunit (sigma70/sigma32)